MTIGVLGHQYLATAAMSLILEVVETTRHTSGITHAAYLVKNLAS